MKKLVKQTTTILALCLVVCCLFKCSKEHDESVQPQGSLPPFWDHIQQFKSQDRIEMPPKNAILFVGSSSIRRWYHLKESFPEHAVINRGFGGSTLADLHFYLEDIVFPYQPKQIVIYSGENDIASNMVDARKVFERLISVLIEIRKRLPNVPIIYISIKPSPSRRTLLEEIKNSNDLIRGLMNSEVNFFFVDVYSLMVDNNGHPQSELFVQDSLHINNKGYSIWQQALEPFLLK